MITALKVTKTIRTSVNDSKYFLVGISSDSVDGGKFLEVAFKNLSIKNNETNLYSPSVCLKIIIQTELYSAHGKFFAMCNFPHAKGMLSKIISWKIPLEA